MAAIPKTILDPRREVDMTEEMRLASNYKRPSLGYEPLWDGRVCNYDIYIFKWLHKLGSLDSRFYTGFLFGGKTVLCDTYTICSTLI